MFPRALKKPRKVLIYKALTCVSADRTGLEPATSAVTGRHSNQLNYRSVLNKTSWFYSQLGCKYICKSFISAKFLKQKNQSLLLHYKN